MQHNGTNDTSDNSSADVEMDESDIGSQLLSKKQSNSPRKHSKTHDKASKGKSKSSNSSTRKSKTDTDSSEGKSRSRRGKDDKSGDDKGSGDEDEDSTDQDEDRKIIRETERALRSLSGEWEGQAPFFSYENTNPLVENMFGEVEKEDEETGCSTGKTVTLQRREEEEAEQPREEDAEDEGEEEGEEEMEQEETEEDMDEAEPLEDADPSSPNAESLPETAEVGTSTENAEGAGEEEDTPSAGSDEAGQQATSMNDDAFESLLKIEQQCASIQSLVEKQSQEQSHSTVCQEEQNPIQSGTEVEAIAMDTPPIEASPVPEMESADTQTDGDSTSMVIDEGRSDSESEESEESKSQDEELVQGDKPQVEPHVMEPLLEEPIQQSNHIEQPQQLQQSHQQQEEEETELQIALPAADPCRHQPSLGEELLSSAGEGSRQEGSMDTTEWHPVKVEALEHSTAATTTTTTTPLLSCSSSTTGAFLLESNSPQFSEPQPQPAPASQPQLSLLGALSGSQLTTSDHHSLSDSQLSYSLTHSTVNHAQLGLTSSQSSLNTSTSSFSGSENSLSSLAMVASEALAAEKAAERKQDRSAASSPPAKFSPVDMGPKKGKLPVSLIFFQTVRFLQVREIKKIWGNWVSIWSYQCHRKKTKEQKKLARRGNSWVWGKCQEPVLQSPAYLPGLHRSRAAQWFTPLPSSSVVRVTLWLHYKGLFDTISFV